MKRNSSSLSYWAGFIGALYLTLMAFGLVKGQFFDATTTLVLIALLAAVQVVVHLRFFLHLDRSASKREDLLLVLFAGLLISLMVGGTFWVMSDLAARMMP